MQDCNSKVVPADPYINLTIEGRNGQNETEDTDETKYREAVGSIMYVTVCTRPDIAYAIGQVAQYCSRPKQSHWTAVQRISAYLKGTSTYGLSYSAEFAHHTLMAYSDSDFAGDLDRR